jgi:hypothetical protein
MPSSTVDMGTPSGENAGFSTWSVTRPSAIVTPIEPIANTNAPATATPNGLGCIRT